MMKLYNNYFCMSIIREHFGVKYCLLKGNDIIYNISKKSAAHSARALRRKNFQKILWKGSALAKTDKKERNKDKIKDEKNSRRGSGRGEPKGESRKERAQSETTH